MRYQLRTGESVEKGIRRVITEQIERSLIDLADPNPDRSHAIHELRKRCKKLRAVLRLVRGGLGNAYPKEDKRYRNIARLLSDMRDADAMIETCDAIADRFVDHVDGGIIRPVRERLKERKTRLMRDTERINAILRDVETELGAGREHAESLDIKGEGYEVVFAGIRKTYSRARTGMDSAYENPAPESFHEWRKWVKYHWYHMRLLSETCQPVARARMDEVDNLAGSLGIYHNLCIFRAMILRDPSSWPEGTDLNPLIGDIDSWTAQIERYNRSLGRRLFGEKPKHLVRRFAENSTVWSEKD